LAFFIASGDQMFYNTDTSDPIYRRAVSYIGGPERLEIAGACLSQSKFRTEKIE
jgi:hypothetical protein